MKSQSEMDPGGTAGQVHLLLDAVDVFVEFRSHHRVAEDFIVTSQQKKKKVSAMARPLSTMPVIARALKLFLPLTSAFLDMMARTMPMMPQIIPVGVLLPLTRDTGK